MKRVSAKAAARVRGHFDECLGVTATEDLDPRARLYRPEMPNHRLHIWAEAPVESNPEVGDGRK
jgi:hypothetical protein